MRKLLLAVFLFAALFATGLFFESTSAYADTMTPVQNCVVLNRNLTLGSSGADVVLLQTFLETNGFLTMPTGVPKGFFGITTQAAVARFQAAKGIFPANGYVGPITRAYIATQTCSNEVSSVSLTSLAPTVGKVGTKVTLHGRGFLSTGNRIMFGSYQAAVVDSSGGDSMSFTIPQSLSNCNDNGGCTEVYIPVVNRNYQVSVINSNGTSNSLPFTVGTAAAMPSTKVLSPNGGESFIAGRSIKVSFSTNQIPVRTQYEIALVGTGFDNDLIGGLTADSNTQAVSVSIPASVPTGDYRIRVFVNVTPSIGCGNDNPCIQDQSDADFRINNLSGNDQSIRVQSPNGGETFRTGEVNSIKWTGDNSNKHIAITLEDSTPGPRYGTKYVIRNGGNVWGDNPHDSRNVRDGFDYFAWLVPSDISSGSYYKVHVADVSPGVPTSGHEDRSDKYFTITASNSNASPIISTLLPSNGKIGTNVTIMGTGFTTATPNVIKFGNYQAATMTSSDGKTISFTVPSSLVNCNGVEGCTQVYIPVTNGNYAVTVVNTRGTSNALSFTVTQGYSPVALLMVNGSTNITADVGDSVVYKWDSANGIAYKSNYTTKNNSTGQSCGLSSANWVANSKSGTATGVIPSAALNCTYTITYTVTGSGGLTASKVITIKVNPPVSFPRPTATLTVNGLQSVTLKAGDHVTYHWSSTNGGSYSSSYTTKNNSTGASCGLSSNNWIANTISGTATGVIPAAASNCTYTIKYHVTGAVGDAESAITIRVNPSTAVPPPTASFSVNNVKNLAVHVGDTITYRWSSTNGGSYSSSYTSANSVTGQSCGSSANWSIVRTASGSANSSIVASSANCVYTIVYKVVGVSGTKQDTITLRVNPAQPDNTGGGQGGGGVYTPPTQPSHNGANVLDALNSALSNQEASSANGLLDFLLNNLKQVMGR